MNHGYQFDIALSAERKTTQERKQAEREARKKLESAAPDLLAALKELHTQEGVTAVGAHNTGSRPDICYVCAAIAKAKQ